MISPKYILCLTADQHGHVIRSLINLRNDLLTQGRSTDAVDDLLEKFSRAKRKRLPI